MNETGETSALPIGIFDSGIGGLTVLKEAIEQLPSEDFIYYADTAHVPYGPKPKEDVRKYVLAEASFLNKKGIKSLVVACNTATSIAINELREKYTFPVIGMEPAVKPAVKRMNGKRVLVLATRLTLEEQKFKDLVARVDNENVVDFLELPELVDLAEQFIFDEETILKVLKDKFRNFSLSSYGTVVLGCTHFPFYKKPFEKFFYPLTDIIDGNIGTVSHLKNTLMAKNLLHKGNKKGSISYYNSGVAADAQRFNKYLKFLRQEV